VALAFILQLMRYIGVLNNVNEPIDRIIDIPKEKSNKPDKPVVAETPTENPVTSGAELAEKEVINPAHKGKAKGKDVVK